MAKDKMNQSIQLIIIGGSAGSLKAVFAILGSLKKDFNIPIVLVLHRDPQGASRLADILSLRTHLNVKDIEDKDLLDDGRVFIAPADYHVLLESDGSFSLDYSEKEHFSRPSIDVSFKSAADVFGAGLISILLSGANSDGALGSKYVQEQGGIVIVQDPGEAEVTYMPQQAIEIMKPDYIAAAKDIGLLLNNFLK